MGRTRKPLEMQKGNLTIAQQEQKKSEESYVITGKEQLAKTPKWILNKIASEEYKRVSKELAKINVIGNLDVNNLAGYCNAYAFYREATQLLQNQSLLIEKETQYGKVTAENPLINIQRKYAEEMRKFASLCGLTVDSRLKAAVVKIHKDEEDILDEFGEI